jgi:hypothetical protein
MFNLKKQTVDLQNKWIYYDQMQSGGLHEQHPSLEHINHLKIWNPEYQLGGLKTMKVKEINGK